MAVKQMIPFNWPLVYVLWQQTGYALTSIVLVFIFLAALYFGK